MAGSARRGLEAQRGLDGGRREDRPSLPPELRSRLDAAGVDLDPRQWEQLPLAARERLLTMPVAGPLERQTFAALVHWLRNTFDLGVGGR